MANTRRNPWTPMLVRELLSALCEQPHPFRLIACLALSVSLTVFPVIGLGSTRVGDVPPENPAHVFDRESLSAMTIPGMPQGAPLPDHASVAGHMQGHARWGVVVVMAGLLVVIVLLAATLAYRGRAGRVIERAKQEWERTFDTVPDLIAVISADHKITRLNAAMAESIGIRPQQAVGKRCYELVHGTGAAPPNCPHAKTIKDGLEHSEVMFEERLGRVFRVSASPISDTSGCLLGSVHVARDITESKIVEEALRASEARYRAVVECQTEMICRFLRDFTITFVNEACCRFFGKKREEIVGDDFLLLFMEEDRDTYVTHLAALEKRDQVSGFECLLVRSDGEPRSILWATWAIFHEKDGLIEYQVAGRDVTDRKRAETELRKSEEKYRTIIESIEDGYYECDLKGRFSFFNDQMRAILGHPAQEKLIGCSYRDFMDEQGARKTYEAFNEVYRTGRAKKVYDQEFVRPDGSRWFGSLSISLITDAQGEHRGFRGICRDTTERTKAEELLLHKERINAVGEMAGGIAHNFNNLLQIVLGCAHLAVNDLESGNAGGILNSLQQIIESSEWGAQTIKRLQDFARARSHDPTTEGQIFDLSETTRAALEMTKPWWKTVPEKEGIKISLTDELEPNCLVRGMENELFEVVVNLVKNAAEAVVNRGTISVSTKVSDGQVLLCVRDDGAGIAAENLGRIFEPFWTSKGVRGTGMGLASSFGIIRQHGGEITVHSKEGDGATFQVRLPLAERSDADPRKTVEPKIEGKLRILAVDDVEAIAHQIQRGLAQSGHEVVAATSGVQAVRLFQQSHFDVVVCDLGMQDINGWQVGKVLQTHCRRNGLQRPVFVLLTGWAGQSEEEEKMRESGVDTVIEKPFNVNALLQTLSRLAAARRRKPTGL